jgi:hypothetical protein
VKDSLFQTNRLTIVSVMVATSCALSEVTIDGSLGAGNGTGGGGTGGNGASANGATANGATSNAGTSNGATSSGGNSGTQTGIGALCEPGSDTCTEGECHEFNQGLAFCSVECLSDSDCGTSGHCQNGDDQFWGEPSASGQWCFPDCSLGGADCQPYGASYACQRLPASDFSESGAFVDACAPEKGIGHGDVCFYDDVEAEDFDCGVGLSCWTVEGEMVGLCTVLCDSSSDCPNGMTCAYFGDGAGDNHCVPELEAEMACDAYGPSAVWTQLCSVEGDQTGTCMLGAGYPETPPCANEGTGGGSNGSGSGGYPALGGCNGTGGCY